MSAKDLKALERRIVEELNKGKAVASLIDEACTSDIVFHDPTGRDIRGLKDFKQYESELFSAFPDHHHTIDDMVAEGDKVAVRFTLTGTHKREIMGIPPTNKKITIRAIGIDRFAGGKLAESWLRFDTLDMMQQLGVIPPPAKGK